MPATTAGALKVVIESLGLGLAAYRDRPSENTKPPYIVIHEAIIITPRGLGDDGDDDAVIEQIQIDLWEAWRNANGSSAENPARARSVELGLKAAELVDLPYRVHGVVGVSRTRRAPDERENLVRNIYTVEVRRDQ